MYSLHIRQVWRKYDLVRSGSRVRPSGREDAEVEGASVRADQGDVALVRWEANQECGRHRWEHHDWQPHIRPQSYFPGGLLWAPNWIL